MATHTNVMIVKVQVPTVTNDPERLCLVYDKDSHHVVQQPIPQKARDAMKGDMRAFFEATFIDGRWNIYKRVPEQFW